jgi:hypothetical protein
MKSLKRIIGLVVVALTAVCVPQPSTFAQTASLSQESRGLVPDQVFLTNAQVTPNDLQVIRAFVRTGTLNNNCLVTLGDTSFVAVGTLVFCAPRHPAGMGKGVLISVFYPQPPPPDFTLSLTLIQAGAEKYEPPVLCTVDGC